MLVFITRIRPTLFFSTGEGDGGGGTDDHTQAEETGTVVAADTPDEGTGSPVEQQQAAQQAAQENWEDRYKEAQGWGTRLSQELAEARPYKQLFDDWNSDDPAARQRVAQALGIELQEDDADDTLDQDQQAAIAALSPEDRQLLDAFRQERAQQAEQQQQAQQYQAYRADVNPQLKDMGIPDKLHDAVAEAALNMDLIPGPYGREVVNLQGAWEQVKAFLGHATEVPDLQQQMLKDYQKTKRAPQVASGGAGTSVPSLDTSASRVKFMMDKIAQQGD